EHECWALSASSVYGEIPCSEPPVNRQGWTVALNANIGWLRTTITGGSAWEYWWLSKSQIFKSTQSTEDQQYFFFLMQFFKHRKPLSHLIDLVSAIAEVNRYRSWYRNIGYTNIHIGRRTTG
ncbi:hypothetical protein ACTXLI_19405, partial [Glutamicibacter arilaitensis]